MTGAPPEIVQWVTRSGDHSDCAVIAIQLATGFTYEEVLSATLAVRVEILGAGLPKRDVKKVLALLGFKSRLRKKFDIEEDTGLLFVANTKDAHMVYLWAGRIVEPRKADRTSLWLDPVAWAKEHKWTSLELFTVEETK